MDTFPVCGRRCFLYVGGTVLRSRQTHLFGDHHALQTIMRVSDPTLYKQYGRSVRNFDATVWENERETIALVGF